MARDTNFEIGNYVHCIKRGAFGLEIFRDESDYWRFVRLLYLCNDTYSDTNFSKIEQTLGIFKRPDYWPPREPLCDIISFVAMPNHFHLLLRETRLNGIGKFMQRLSGSLTMGFNSKYGNKGSIFQGTYKPVLVEEEYHHDYLIPYINVKNVMELYPHGGLKGAYDNFEEAFAWAKTYRFSSLNTILHGAASPLLSMDTLARLGFPVTSEQLPAFKAAALTAIETALQKK